MEEELGLRDLSRQLLHGGGALSSATKLQQSLFVSGVFDDFSTVVASLVRGDDLLALQDTDPSVRGGQDEVFIRRGMRNGVIIEVESDIDTFSAVDGPEKLGFESMLGQGQKLGFLLKSKTSSTR